MKSPVYTLVNEEFAFFVNIAGETFAERKIPYVIVGGIATQAHVLDRLCRTERKDIVTLAADENFRDQDYLRATDAMDIALKFPEYVDLEGYKGNDIEQLTRQAHLTTATKISESCRRIIEGGEERGNYLSSNGEHIFSYGQERTGIRKPIFNVSVDKSSGSPIYLKIARRPEDLEALDTAFYHEFVDSAVDLSIPYHGGWNLELRVLRPEHLMAVKLALDRPKDAMDVRNLVHALRLAGEFDKRDDFPRFCYQLRRCLLPRYQRQLLGFADSVGIDRELLSEKPKDISSESN